MNIVYSIAFIGSLLAAIAVFAHHKRPTAHARALLTARRHAASIAPRLPFALLAAECIGRLLPPNLISAWIGADSGIGGTLIASVIGAILPGGPMLAFPLAIALSRAGAGMEALVALITAWALVAVFRTMLFELPFMGRSFTWHRLAVSAPLPVIAGLTATALVGLLN